MTRTYAQYREILHYACEGNAVIRSIKGRLNVERGDRAREMSSERPKDPAVKKFFGAKKPTLNDKSPQAEPTLADSNISRNRNTMSVFIRLEITKPEQVSA